MNRTHAARSASDIDVLALAVLGLAGAFVTQPLLHAVGTPGEIAPSLVARLAPSQTVDRLWVVFVLIPAAIAFVGIGIPYAFRVAVAAVRGRLDRRGKAGVLALATSIALVAAELALGRSGIVSLVLTSAAAAWAARGALAGVGLRIAPHLLAVAGLALVGLAFYERRLQAGGAASIAIAPTLVLTAFYACVTASVTAMAAGLRPLDGRGVASEGASPRESRAFGRAGLAAALVSAGWLAGSRYARTLAASPDVAELTLTVAASAAFLVLARFAWRADRPELRAAAHR